MINPFTGKFKEQGHSCNIGFNTAISELRPEVSRKINFVYEDDTSTAQGAVSSFYRISRSKDSLATFMPGSYAALGVNPIAKKFNIPLLGLVSAEEFTDDSPHTFTYWPDQYAEARHLYNYVKDKNFSRIGIITLENDFTLDIRNSLLENFKKQTLRL